MSKPKVTRKPARWEADLEARLPLFGHRNWIVIADSAYPAHSGAGIETVVADAAFSDVLRIALKRIAAHPHIRSNAHTDSELEFVDEKDAPGITKLRHQLDSLLKNLNRDSLPHEALIAKLDQSAREFRILIVKTNLALPYTSVFLELDCAYWNSEAEQRLRQSMLSQ